MGSLFSRCLSRAFLLSMDSSSIEVGSCRSAIIFPEDKETIIHSGSIALQGWAYSGGGNWVERVEVSPDG